MIVIVMNNDVMINYGYDDTIVHDNGHDLHYNTHYIWLKMGY